MEPPLEDLQRLGLEPGERLFLDYLLRHLPEEWEIYVQPPLNGKRPDVIVMNPAVGIGVFEVKNWDLPLYSVRGQRIIGQSARGEFPAGNPWFQAQAYRGQIFGVLAPSLTIARADDRRAFGCVQLGVVFPHENATEEAARRLLRPFMSEVDQRYVAIIGRDTLDQGEDALVRVLRDANRRNSLFFNEDIANELRRWVSEPEAEREQREPLHLTPRQRELATTRTRSGFRRVKGAAGSGKSQALAARAAQLALEGRSVLVCAFNITMVNYLPDIAVRYENARPAVRRRCHFTWFHRWCRDTIVELAGQPAWKALFAGVPDWEVDRVLAEEVPTEVRRLARENDQTLSRFDAILVDEGQDWLPNWWNTLRLFLADGGEMLLVADQTQDLYGRTGSWTDQAMTGAGFPGGNWFQLTGSHRVHPSMVPMLRGFVERFLPGGEAPAPAQLELAFGTVRLTWVNAVSASPGQLVSALLRAMPRLLGGRAIPYPDTTILLESHDAGLELLADLDIAGAELGHVFDRDREVQRARKVKFRKGMGMLKACTVHSFKGWEDRALVVVVRRFGDAESSALLYTALSRVKRARDGAWLGVVSYAPELQAFGQEWFNVMDERELLPNVAQAVEVWDDIPF